MTDTVRQQLLQALAAFVLGTALGVVYDALRVPATTQRKRRIGVVVLAVGLDLAFWLSALCAVFWFAMSVGGGELRLYALASICAGGLLYRRLFSKWVRRLLTVLFQGVKRLLRLVFAPLLAARKAARQGAQAHKALRFTQAKHRATKRLWRKTIHDTQRKTREAHDDAKKTQGQKSAGANHHRSFRALYRHAAHQQPNQLEQGARADRGTGTAQPPAGAGQRRYQSTKRVEFRL